jgi:hypothetical protein
MELPITYLLIVGYKENEEILFGELEEISDYLMYFTNGILVIDNMIGCRNFCNSCLYF